MKALLLLYAVLRGETRNPNYLSVLTTSRKESTKEKYEKIFVDDFTTFASTDDSSLHGCAVACLKHESKECKSFSLQEDKEDGSFKCELGKDKDKASSNSEIEAYRIKDKWFTGNIYVLPS